MKISGNFPIKYIQQNYQKNKTVIKEQAPVMEHSKAGVVNPMLYQAYNNISFSGIPELDEILSVNYISCLRESRRRDDEIVFSYTDVTGKRQKSVIPPRTVTNLLKDENDEVEKKWLDIYVGLYSLKRNELMEEANESASFLQDLAKQQEEKNNKRIVGFKTAEQLKGEELVRQKVRNLSVNTDEFDAKATLFATLAVRILRGDVSIDSTRFNQKMLLAQKLFSFNEKFESPRSTELVVNKSKTPDGKIDLDFCSKLTDLLINNGILPKGAEEAFIDYSIETLKNILDSSDDKKQVFECALDLMTEGFFVHPDDKIFETMFDLCVNPRTKKFDIIAFDRLMAASECYEEVISSQIEIENAQEYDENEKRRKQFIYVYMANIIDLDSGEIKKDAISPDDFLNEFFEEE